MTERESDLPTGSRRVLHPSKSSKVAGTATGSALDSVPARSMTKPRAYTQRGLSDSRPPPKVVTKHGLAPPPPTSTPPPPPPDDPEFRPEFIPPSSKVPHFEGLEQTWGPDHQALLEARDEPTPAAHEISDFEEDLQAKDRSIFQTSHGGGKNRISGGRSAARAYVSPSTLAPSHGSSHHTKAVKIHESVREESYRYTTEPSLLRRRQSSLPAAPAVAPQRRTLIFWVLALSLFGGFGTGLAALAYYRGQLPERVQSSKPPRGEQADPALALSGDDQGKRLGIPTQSQQQVPAPSRSENSAALTVPLPGSGPNPVSAPTASGSDAPDLDPAGEPTNPSPARPNDEARAPNTSQPSIRRMRPPQTKSGVPSAPEHERATPPSAPTLPAHSNDDLWLE